MLLQIINYFEVRNRLAYWDTYKQRKILCLQIWKSDFTISSKQPNSVVYETFYLYTNVQAYLSHFRCFLVLVWVLTLPRRTLEHWQPEWWIRLKAMRFHLHLLQGNNNSNKRVRITYFSVNWIHLNHLLIGVQNLDVRILFF